MLWMLIACTVGSSGPATPESTAAIEAGAMADVAHYVRPGSLLDRDALDRGNSVYFPDRVVPMLPERISNDLCSLKPQVDRAAIAVRMVIAPDCGMKYLPRDVAYRKLANMVLGRNMVRDALRG